MMLSNNECSGMHSTGHRSACSRLLLLPALLLTLGAACNIDGEKSTTATGVEKRSTALMNASNDWKAGKDPALVERVEYLTAQLDEYRQNLPPLEAFGYRPALNGIWTGMVIVCGHVVPPPYHIEVDNENDLIRINGIELTNRNRFNVYGKCTAKISAIHAAREHAKYQAWKKEMDARPDVEEQCAKKKEITSHGIEYFEKRIRELDVVVDKESGQPNNWDLVFRACRDTKAELERVYGDNLERIELPETKGDVFAFYLKKPISHSHCNSGQLLVLGRRFRDKLLLKKMYLHDDKEIAKYEAFQAWQKNDLINSWEKMFRNWLQRGDILLFGPQDSAEYNYPTRVAAIVSLLNSEMTPERKFSTLLDAGIGTVDYHFVKDKSFLDFRSNETLIMLVMAAQTQSWQGH